MGVGDFFPGFYSGLFFGFENPDCGTSQIASHESLVETACPWIGGSLVPGSAWFLGFLTVLASGDRSGRGLITRRSRVRIPPPLPSRGPGPIDRAFVVLDHALGSLTG